MDKKELLLPIRNMAIMGQHVKIGTGWVIDKWCIFSLSILPIGLLNG